MDSAQLVAWRDRNGLTQDRAAAKLGVSRNTVQNWENGQTGIPKIVETGCKMLEHRLRQENPALGPVTLVYTDAPMWVSPYGARGPMAMMRQETLPNNSVALGRVLELWGGPQFQSPLILAEGEEMLWNAVELQRVAINDDLTAPTPRRWRSWAISDVAEYLREVAQKYPVRSGPKEPTAGEISAWLETSTELISRLDGLAKRAMAGEAVKSEVGDTLAALRDQSLFPKPTLSTALAQAFTWSVLK